MLLLLCLEVESLCAGEFALFAADRLFSRMDQHVSLEDRSLCAGEFALSAVKRLFSRMD